MTFYRLDGDICCPTISNNLIHIFYIEKWKAELMNWMRAVEAWADYYEMTFGSTVKPFPTIDISKLMILRKFYLVRLHFL